MNILLIYPMFPDTSASPPLGLPTVASMLPADWSTRLLDLNVDSITDKDLAWADMAFVGAMAVQRESAKHVIARCKASNLKIVAGGPLFTAEPDEFKEVDHLVLDEAETTLPAFLSDLRNGQPKKIYRAACFCDVRETPPPPWDLVKMKRYGRHAPGHTRNASL